MIKPQISYEDFDKVDIRVGKVIGVEDLLGKQVVCVVNFAPRQIRPVALTTLKEVPLGRGVK